PAPAPSAAPAGRGVRPGSGPQAALAPTPDDPLVAYGQFDAVVALIRERRDMRLLVEVETCLKLVRYSPGRIEFEPTAEAAPDLAARLAGRLQDWTGARWGVSVVSGGGAPTIAQTRDAAESAARTAALDNPLVKAVFDAFPGARIDALRHPDTRPETAAASEALPEVEDEWDPFEQD
ncbi:DNA polymerase III subunit gamma/tau, partial [Rhodobacteraceae bacterium 2376]|nr:DNA polymerase III subunit gamma/tau [Rhabdonatronobacter sediminivivens]